MPDLQTAWFLLVGVLIAGYAVLDGFDLGVGVLHLIVAKDDRERRVLLNAVGPVWDGNEVWLLTAGGALFAAFPMVYATVFSGLYLALMLVLLGLVFRAVSVEFRSKEEAPAWRRFWDIAFSVGSLLPALLFGVAIGNVLRGLPLDPVTTEFDGTFLGLLNPFALVVGLLGLAMFVMQGAAWLAVKTEGALRDRAFAACRVAWFGFAALWLAATFYSRVEAPHLWRPYAAPLAWAAPVLFVVAAALVPVFLARRRARFTFAATTVAIIALVGVMGQSLYPSLVPALGGGAGLTVANASSTTLTLRTMLVIALAGVPVVLAYTLFIYSRFFGPVVLDEHSY